MDTMLTGNTSFSIGKHMQTPVGQVVSRNKKEIGSKIPSGWEMDLGFLVTRTIKIFAFFSLKCD